MLHVGGKLPARINDYIKEFDQRPIKYIHKVKQFET
jgi:hypothetical protein